ARAARDLDRLEAFLDAALTPIGLDRAAVFTPIFRQPYGGAALNQTPGRIAAAERGWTYRGYAIDSLDWLRHADADPALAEALGVANPEVHAALIQDRLAAAAERFRHAGSVDVLLHVNHLTAGHLDDWM